MSLRIILLHTLATLTIGMNGPYMYPLIEDTRVISFGYGQNCVFIIAAVLGRPLFTKHFIIFSATTDGANGLHNAPRTDHAVTGISKAWPYYLSHIISAMFEMLEFLAAHKDSQGGEGSGFGLEWAATNETTGQPNTQ